MRKQLLSLFAAASLVSVAQDRICINGDWQFRYARDTRQADSICGAGFYKPGFDAAGFDVVKVPSCWAVLGYEEPVYREFKDAPRSEGFYLRRFRVPEAFGGRRVLLRFGGVWASAEVWLNGERVGRHDSGYTSFGYDVTGMLKPGADNLLAVRVRQVYPGYVCDTYDDWSLGGIYRDVTLESMPRKRWIDDVRITTDFDDAYRDADLRVKVMVIDAHKNTLPGNYRSPGRPYVLRMTLADSVGNTVAERRVDVAAHTSTGRLTDETVRVAAPRQWNAENPYLYTLRVELMEGDTVTQTAVRKVGFREISTTGDVFRINGQNVKLRGVNHHDEHPDVGRATTREHWLADLRMMKAAGVNYVRAAHYQHAKGFIEMCDSVGMYVGAEVSLGGAGGLMTDPGFIAGSMLRTVETVTRDVNNPSVVYWSVGNEDAFTTMYLQAAQVVKALDGTRPVLLPWNADATLPGDIDILAPHYWTAQEYDSLAAGSRRPVITTEYTHAYGTDRFGGLADRWRALTRHDAGTGGAVWMWADQGIRTPVPRDEKEYGRIVKDDKYMRMSTAGWDGVVDAYRRPTRDYEELRAVYAPVQPAADSVRVPAGAATVDIPVRNGYDFTPLSAVSIGWQLCADGRVLDSGTGRADAAPHATGRLTVPVDRLRRAGAGQTCYLLLVFTGADGMEITRRTVELVPEPGGKTVTPGKTGRLRFVTEDGITTVRAGKTEYVFSGKTGSLKTMRRGGRTLMGEMRPTVWHKLNDGDQAIKNRKFAKGVSLDKLKADVKSYDEYCSADSVVVKSTVEYTADADNRVTADFVFTVYGDGRMAVSYALDTKAQTNWLPLAGVQVTMPDAAVLASWFGLGPSDAYPNKQAAPVLGVWDGRQAYGNKAVRWTVLRDGKAEAKVRSSGYISRDVSSPEVLRFVPYVLGRTEKGRLKEPGTQLPSEGVYAGRLVVE